MTNADRIAELYRGEIMNRETQRRARERVDWLVRQARGAVLDVGCSQGIAAFLCARRGLRVVGVDIEPDRIAQAREERDRKPTEVAELVEFRVTDGSRLEFPDDSFDTVLLGEVLEHLDDLRPFLTEIGRVCKPDGVIAITTPFGIFPHEDHSQTFFLGSLIDRVGEVLTIDFLDIVDGYFRVAARPRPMSRAERERLVLGLQPLYEQRIGDVYEELYFVRERRKRLTLMARELNRRLIQRRRAHERARWKLRAKRRTRWSRLGTALARVRQHPGRALVLPRDIVRALRKRPAPAKSRRPRGVLRTLEAQWEPMRKHASVATTAPHALRIEVPEVEVPEGPVARPELKVAVILDRFSASAFRYEWDQVQFGPEDWRETVERERPQLLFVESAWRGNDDRWRDVLVGGTPYARRPLTNLVEWCRERGVPTAFWNKEDPPNFSHFVDTAAHFDHVFTVDGETIPRYAEVLGREDVEVLQFGAQPRIHNPIAVSGGRSRDLAFGGSYIGDRHPSRRAQMETILAPAREFGLEIFSRIIQGEDPRFDWPPEYQPHIVGSLPYERMLAAYRLYKLFLNVNSVIDSPTMCARRVFELSACSTPVLSGYARAIEEVFGDLVPIARTAEETRVGLAELLSDDEARERRAHLAMREVHSRHTYGHRVERVLAAAGLPTRELTPTVSVLARADSPAAAERAIATAAAQAHRPLELVLAAEPGTGDREALAARAREGGVEAIALEVGSAEPGAALDAALDVARGELVAAIDPEASYSEHYLTDLLHAHRYAAAPVVGKRAGTEHAYTDELDPGALLAERELAARLLFSPGGERELVRRAAAEGARVYAADRFSFVARGAVAGEATIPR